MNKLLISDLSVQMNDRTIVPSFNLTVHSGEVVFITGDNGSGKSTLLKTIARYLPLKKGVIHFFNKDALDFTPATWHRHIHYLPQHNSLAFPVKVQDLLLMAFYREKKWFEAYTQHQLEAVTDMAKRFGILHLLGRNAKELSGGELQLCWLVQSFLASPEVLLLDEPTQYLDAKNRTAFFSILQEMQTIKPFICLCVTHDLPFRKEVYGTVVSL